MIEKYVTMIEKDELTEKERMIEEYRGMQWDQERFHKSTMSFKALLPAENVSKFSHCVQARGKT